MVVPNTYEVTIHSTVDDSLLGDDVQVSVLLIIFIVKFNSNLGVILYFDQNCV